MVILNFGNKNELFFSFVSPFNDNNWPIYSNYLTSKMVKITRKYTIYNLIILLLFLTLLLKQLSICWL